MITLFGVPSPNVLKILLMLEEAEVAYELRRVAVMHGEGGEASFRELNPLGKVPVIIDRTGNEPKTLYESGAILIYLAETYAPALLSGSGTARWQTLQWLAVQMSFAGPMLGQMNHFQLIPSEAGSYASVRYRDQARSVYRHFDERLRSAEWLGGDAYSIADIAMHPWSAYLERHGFDPADFPSLAAWRARIDQRPAWIRAHAAIPGLVGDDLLPPSDANMDHFFGRSEAGPQSDFERYLALGAMIRPAL